MMIRISWTEPEDSPIRPGHESVLVAPWTMDEAQRFAEELLQGRVEFHIEEI